ncbi:importin subunit alpha-1-like [Arabidopsis lyrata subsp. lyrata]|uniref:importin subunit alpha-1-like n=1 Tax=Arabidopsis lyrata subsp. lyrata TaxID=81972 RepID=UPI000A29B650|nr:importin subunit alpha-1-like [Arabidopsis lyrata subsp. lyrata]|eukprot:XP_020890243.1 importin subunit alpha-1-like [Arabidopsis lyrata subsp. lyrata]
MIDGLFSDDPSRQLEYATKFNAFLSSHEENLPFDEIEVSVFVARFVEFCKKNDKTELQSAAASVLINMSKRNTKVLIDHGAVPIFVHLLRFDTGYLQFQATWALGNVASASTQSRDDVLRCGALIPLLAQLHVNNHIMMLRFAAWTLSTFCFGQPRPPFHQEMKPALAVLGQVLRFNDKEVLSHACRALYYLFDGSRETSQNFIAAGLVPGLVQLLGYGSPAVIEPAIRTIRNLTNVDDQQTKIVVINCGALRLLANLLTQNHQIAIKRGACSTISNITAGTKELIQSVIDANLIPILVNIAQNAKLGIKETALCAIVNATLRGSYAQIEYLVEQGCIQTFCDLLICPDRRIISVCLDGLENILNAAWAEKKIEDMQSYCQLIQDAEGIEKIQKLVQIVSYEINTKSSKILQTYGMIYKG